MNMRKLVFAFLILLSPALSAMQGSDRLQDLLDRTVNLAMQGSGPALNVGDLAIIRSDKIGRVYRTANDIRESYITYLITGDICATKFLSGDGTISCALLSPDDSHSAVPSNWCKALPTDRAYFWALKDRYEKQQAQASSPNK